MLRQDLRDPGGGKRVLGGYVEGRTVEALRRWQLGAEKEGQEKLGLSCAAEGN